MTRRTPRPADAARVLAALDGEMTASQIAFASGLHPGRARRAIELLIRDGVVRRSTGLVRWQGRGNGTAFVVEDTRDVYGLRNATPADPAADRAAWHGAGRSHVGGREVSALDEIDTRR